MKPAARILALTLVVCASLTSLAHAVVLAEYDALGAATNPNTQGWTWNGAGSPTLGGTSLLIAGGSNPPILFTETVPANVFYDAWSYTGNHRFAGNSQEEFGRMMFVDDGSSLWHLSFLNTGADAIDGIYNGGDPNGPPLSVTATKIWAEPVPQKPFDSFIDYALVDPDGRGGNPPELYVAGAPVVPAVFALATPSLYPAGTIGFGSLNPNETGFLQTARMVFDGNPNAVPEPATALLAGIALCGLARLSRHARGQ